MNYLRKLFEGKEKERKYGLLIIFIIGIILITIAPSLVKSTDDDVPIEILGTSDDAKTSQNTYEKDIEDRLTYILSKVEGAGSVSVMVTTTKGSQLVVSESIEESINTIDESDQNNGTRQTEQLTTKKSAQILGQNEQPLVLTEIVPEISGVLVVCDGANNIVVKDSIVRSVSTLLSIPSYKVEVLQK